MRDAQPKSIYLKDYQPPHFVIEETHLRFDLHEDYAQVDSRLIMRRNREQHEGYEGPLVLVGQQLELLTIKVNGELLNSNEYQLDEDALTVHKVSNEFELEISTRTEQQSNTALEGLYKSGGMFCTQCEAEGFRRITYYLDRPDVMSRFTTTIAADKTLYPV